MRVIVFLFICLLFIFPAGSLEAGIRGIGVWWEVLFPALFPFFVLSELMLGLGIVHFVGALFDPIMRPVFRVTGKGGFVMAMGFASGYPVGARLTAQLWSQGSITREEGERLVAFTSTSDPIFLIGAVSVGFFHSPELALILVSVHYGSGLVIGWLMRFHAKGKMSTEEVSTGLKRNIVRSAFQQMHLARVNDGRSFWQLLEQAIRSSILLVFMIGGLVVFFSVLIEVVKSSGVLPLIVSALGVVLSFIGLPVALAESLVYGLFEVTLGAKTAAQASSGIALVDKVAVASIVLAWAGLSVHAQIISLLNETNLRYTPFVLARLLHAALAFIFVLLFWDPLYAGAHSLLQMNIISAWIPSEPTGLAYIPLTVILFVSMLVLFILFTALLYVSGLLLKKINRS